MIETTKLAVIAHAYKEFPREACGLVVIVKGREAFIPCRNEAVGTDQFVLSPVDYAAAEAKGEIVAVVHSHPNLPARASQADLVSCEASGLPWHIVSIPGGQWETITPSGYRAPLVGRQWSHGVLDCYAIIRDWYQDNRGITLLDFERHDEWWKRGSNLYTENFAKAGFAEVDPETLQEGDVILMQAMSDVPNHAAIYLGDGVMLHHVQNRLSSRDIYGGYWLKNTTHVLRYEKDHSVG